jgi:Fe-S-cluster-containing hydrogenase component 2
MTEAGKRRLIIDLAQCDRCESCGVHCDYYYRPHEQDHGLLGLRERATFELVCRRCEFASCVIACPFEAIERQGDGVIRRYNLRCVSCKLCALACPFGTIYPDMLPFYETPCDACLNRNDEAPPCVASCGQGALEYRLVDPVEKEVHIVDEHLAARTHRWVKREEGEEVKA